MTLALLGFLAAINPAAAALALTRDRPADEGTTRLGPVAVGVAVAVAVYLALAAAATSVLDALDVNLGTFRLGAGIVVAAAGLRWLVAGPVASADEPGSAGLLAVFIALPVVCTPGAAALAVSVGAEDGVVPVAIAALVAGGLAGLAVLRRDAIPTGVAAGLTRFLGGAATLVGILVAVDGVRTL